MKKKENQNNTKRHLPSADYPHFVLQPLQAHIC